MRMAGGSSTARHFKQARKRHLICHLIFRLARRSCGEPQDQFCSGDKYFHAKCVFISWACLGLFF
jgi:hypothetical protein